MLYVAIVVWILFHCVNHQLSCHKPTGEGIVNGVVYQTQVNQSKDLSEQHMTRRHHQDHWYVPATNSLRRPEELCTTKAQGIQWCLMKMSKEKGDVFFCSMHTLTRAVAREWHPAIICSVPCSSSKMVHHHPGTWLLVNPLIIIS
jgi:hypothetical protein